MNKRKMVIFYVMFLLVSIFIGHNIICLMNTENKNSDYENKVWEDWLHEKEKHLRFLETNIAKSYHYIKKNKHFYKINVIKKFNENIENSDIKGIDANGFYIDIDIELFSNVFIERYRMFGRYRRLNKLGRNKMKYEVINITISAPVELKTILIKDKNYKDNITDDTINEYKNGINSLIKEDFVSNDKTANTILIICLITFLNIIALSLCCKN